MAQVVTHCVPGKFNAMIQVHGHVIGEVAYVIPGLNSPLLDPASYRENASCDSG